MPQVKVSHKVDLTKKYWLLNLKVFNKSLQNYTEEELKSIAEKALKDKFNSYSIEQIKSYSPFDTGGNIALIVKEN